jgi:hypothetical protein
MIFILSTKLTTKELMTLAMWIKREASQLQFQIRSSSFRLNLEPEAWRSCSNGSNSTKPSPILTIIFLVILLQEKDHHITQSLSRYCF